MKHQLRKSKDMHKALTLKVERLQKERDEFETSNKNLIHLLSKRQRAFSESVMMLKNSQMKVASLEDKISELISTNDKVSV